MVRFVFAVVVLRVEAALGVRFAVLFDVEDVVLVDVVGLREDVLRVVVVDFDLDVVAFVGVDFFRVDDVFVVLGVAVFRFEVVPFLVAILPLPAK